MSLVSLPALALHIVFFKPLGALCPAQGFALHIELSLRYAERNTKRTRWDLIECRKNCVFIKMAKRPKFLLINSLLTAFPVQARTCVHP